MPDSPNAVLIVDDNYLVRAALRVLVEGSMSLEVCGEASDGTEAVERAKQLRPSLVLMDLSMPNMNGVQAAWLIRQAVPRARIVLFSLYADSVGKTLATIAGVDLVVAKSEGAAGLMKALHPILENQAPGLC
jgi:DNA-binding NarL/FixJ family response regulator